MEKLYITEGERKADGRTETIVGRRTYAEAMKWLPDICDEYGERYVNIRLEECSTPLVYIYALILEVLDSTHKKDIETTIGKYAVTSWIKEPDFSKLPFLLYWGSGKEEAEEIMKAVGSVGGVVKVLPVYDDFFKKEDILPENLNIPDLWKKMIREDRELQRYRFGIK